MAVKTRNAYRSYTAADIYNRASVTADKTQQATSVDFYNISTSKVRNVLSGANNSVYQLCRHANVNHWSAYGPTVRSVTGSGLTKTLLNSDPTTCRLADFAGYNHSATAPYFINKGSYTNTRYNGPTSAHEFRCRINIGELTYDDITGGTQPSHVAFSVWNGGTCVGGKVKAIGSTVDGQDNGKDILDFDTGASYRINPGTISYTTDFTLKIWFISSGTWDQAGGNLVFKITELADWTETVTILSSTHFMFNAPYDSSGAPLVIGGTHGGTYYSDLYNTYEYPLTGDWCVKTPSFTYSTAIFQCQFISTKYYPGPGQYQNYTNAHISIVVEEGYFDSGQVWHGTVVNGAGYDHLYSGAWDDSSAFDFATTFPTGVYLNFTPQWQDYGYRIIIDIDCT